MIYLYMERFSGWLLGLAGKRAVQTVEAPAQPELFDELAERRAAAE